jgi:hypothetical protein
MTRDVTKKSFMGGRIVTMAERKLELPLEEDLCIHIFTVSAAMVGVCLTVIGLIRIVITLQNVDTLADDLLAADSLLYLASCVLSYSALRTRKARRMHRVERVADGVFLLAMVLMVGICLFITYALAMGSGALHGPVAGPALQG